MPNETITIPGYMGKPWTITGDLSGRLMVHKTGKSWVVTHTVSGAKVCGEGYRLKRDAIAARGRLLALLADWAAPDIYGLAKAAGINDPADFARAVRPLTYEDKR